MANKMTKKDFYFALREIVSDNADMVAFIDHEIELLERKASTPRGETKTQIENKALQADIIEYLTAVDAPQTIKQIQAGVPSIAEASNQKVTHLLTPLVASGVLVKTYEKKVPFFTIAQ